MFRGWSPILTLPRGYPLLNVEVMRECAKMGLLDESGVLHWPNKKAWLDPGHGVPLGNEGGKTGGTGDTPIVVSPSASGCKRWIRTRVLRRVCAIETWHQSSLPWTAERQRLKAEWQCPRQRGGCGCSPGPRRAVPGRRRRSASPGYNGDTQKGLGAGPA